MSNQRAKETSQVPFIRQPLYCFTTNRVLSQLSISISDFLGLLHDLPRLRSDLYKELFMTHMRGLRTIS